MFKRFWIVIFLITIHNYNVESKESFHSSVTFSQKEDTYFLHTVERGQTVYSLSVMYDIAVDSIYQLNPDSRNGIREGEKLKIPQKSQKIVYHTIEPKETLYSVSKKYNIKGEDIIEANPGLSTQTFNVGKTILIPLYKEISMGPGQTTNIKVSENTVNSLLKQYPLQESMDEINISLLLTFGTVDKDSVSSLLSQRFIEYYEGFLLALDSLKKMNISVNLNVYDIGIRTESLNKVLNKEALKNSHLIIGGGTDDQIGKISGFSKENAIRYVVPFSSRIDETLSNPYLFQINTPQSYLYSKVSSAFSLKYTGDPVIFIRIHTQNDKEELINTIKSDMKSGNQNFSDLVYNESTFSSDLKKRLSDTKNNVLVLSSGASEALIKIAGPLRKMRETDPGKIITLFGFPEWQTYMREHMDDFFSTNTSIYSIFYANNTQPEVKNFHQLFKNWYGKNMINSYPKYGMLGYDTGMYFIQMIHKYGANFEASLDKFNYQSLQTGFKFKRVSTWGGFVNMNIYWVNFLPDFSIQREVTK